VLNLEKILKDRVPNLIGLCVISTPNMTTQSSCAALCLTYGLWVQMNDRRNQFVFPRADLVKLSDPYNAPPHKITADKFRESIEATIPTLSMQMTSRVLLEIKGLWMRDRNASLKLKEFDARMEEILDISEAERAPVRTIQLFDFLFELSTPVNKTA